MDETLKLISMTLSNMAYSTEKDKVTPCYDIIHRLGKKYIASTNDLGKKSAKQIFKLCSTIKSPSGQNS